MSRKACRVKANECQMGEAMVQEELAAEDQATGLSMGAIVATAIAAGVIAYVIRRARLPDEARVRGSRRAHWGERADLRGRTAAATREFVSERILPEMKPVLLDRKSVV